MLRGTLKRQRLKRGRNRRPGGKTRDPVWLWAQYLEGGGAEAGRDGMRAVGRKRVGGGIRMSLCLRLQRKEGRKEGGKGKKEAEKPR